MPDARARFLTFERRLLFLDLEDVQSRRNVVQAVCRAEKHRDNPVMAPGHRRVRHQAGALGLAGVRAGSSQATLLGLAAPGFALGSGQVH